jgi:hypothetical protein
LRHHNDDRFITFLNRWFEQLQLHFDSVLKYVPGACGPPALRIVARLASPRGLARFIIPLAPGVLTLRMGGVGFERAILIVQLMFTPHVPPPFSNAPIQIRRLA